jgi:hypothetical protein
VPDHWQLAVHNRLLPFEKILADFDGIELLMLFLKLGTQCQLEFAVTCSQPLPVSNAI